MEMALVVLILAAGFYMAWNIGANDVANAMGTAVGSGALTLKQAVCIAALMEFCGAYFFGSHVSETVQRGIVSPEVFEQNWNLFTFGMLASLLAAGTWLQIASYYGWPVSTTHTIVGAIAGFGLIIGGIDALQWDNLAKIVSSWIVSPLIGGTLAYFTFTFLRRQILYKNHPLRAAKRLIPILAMILVGSLLFLLAPKNLLLIVSGAALAGGAVFIGLRSITSRSRDETGLHPDYGAVEKAFGLVQMMSSSVMAFSHGANDVANAIGPLSAAIMTLKHGYLPVETLIPTWALVIGGFGIVVGLATWGWRVIETIGKKITELTPTRGFAAEFGAALTILVASRLGMPISTTHTLVGAVIGVGLARGLGAIDLSTIRDIALSWVVTVPAGALLAVGYFYLLQFAFSP